MKLSRDKKIINYIAIFVTGCVATICGLPFIMVISASISNEKEVLTSGYSIFPKGLSFETYKAIFSNPGQILNAYGITVSVTIIGTITALFITSMTAYALSRKDFPYRNKIAFFIYFTTLFSGGLVSTYFLLMKYYGMKNNYLVLILPALLSPYYILIMRNFVKTIPFELTESGRIDGANDFNIFVKIILPVMKPSLASIGMFIALNYWNEWFHVMLYIENEKLYTLQYLLYKMINSIEFLKSMSNMVTSDVIISSSRNLPTETMKMAMTVIAVGPVLFLYPYIQKYFIQGLTVGSVKG